MRGKFITKNADCKVFGGNHLGIEQKNRTFVQYKFVKQLKI